MAAKAAELSQAVLEFQPDASNATSPPSSAADLSSGLFSPKFYTGSFTGWGLATGLGSGYATATDNYAQPLCANEEGWGPFSPYRWDFTPCFVDVWIASVAVFGIVFGAGALVWLVKKRPSKSDTARNWHFWIKQVSLDY